MAYPYFNNKLVVTPLRKKLFKVLEEFTYFRSEDEDYSVPRAFVTDFFSIPWGFRWLFRKNQGPENIVAVLHDWHCEKKNIPHKLAHELFEEGLELFPIKKWRKNTMVWAVKNFGPRW